MSTILEQIVGQTRADLVKRRHEISLRDLESMPCYESPRRNFRQALGDSGLSVIAEIKKASPSKGVIRNDFDPLKLAESYRKGGAAALSILTDTPFFQGELSYLESVSLEFDIPLLRKDFIIEPYQIAEARAYGADAVLLIVGITKGNQLDELLAAAEEYELQTLVECYGEEEVRQLDWQKVPVLGVNNRDLHTFEVDLHRGIELLQRSPDSVIKVSESGLSSSEDLQLLADEGIDAALIGEHFMRQPDPGAALKEMLACVQTVAEGSEKGRSDGIR